MSEQYFMDTCNEGNIPLIKEFVRVHNISVRSRAASLRSQLYSVFSTHEGEQNPRIIRSMFTNACYAGNVEVASLMLSMKGADISFLNSDYKLLEHVCYNNLPDVLSLLLSLERFLYEGQTIQEAHDNTPGPLEGMPYLFDKILRNASVHGHYEILSLIHPRSKRYMLYRNYKRNDLLIEGSSETINVDRKPITWAAYYGHKRIVDFFIREDKLTDKTLSSSVIAAAFAGGHMDLVKYIIQAYGQKDIITIALLCCKFYDLDMFFWLVDNTSIDLFDEKLYSYVVRFSDDEHNEILTFIDETRALNF